MIWHPYTQMATATPPLRVKSAQNHTLTLEDGRTLIDTISSWWCMIHGYAHPELNAALKTQIDQLPHVMLGGLTHQSAETLAKTLVEITPEGLNHVFFSDSGSVGVEVALKMALQYWKNQGKSQKSTFVALRDGYHGDTTGAMSVSDPIESMHPIFHDILPRHQFIPSPARNLMRSLEALEIILKQQAHQIAALIIEPLLQGAGGLLMYDPSFLVQAQALCKAHDILLICDEIATGFGRTGSLFAVNQAAITPDIMILGKALTGGYLGHAATLATTTIFNAFYDKDPNKAFMHGPTFMGNPLACTVAQKSIEIFQRDHYLDKIQAIESLLKKHLLSLTHPLIKTTRVMGATGVIELHHPAPAHFQRDMSEKGIWNRPFGNVIYLMPPYIITPDALEYCLETIQDWFSTHSV